MPPSEAGIAPSMFLSKAVRTATRGSLARLAIDKDLRDSEEDKLLVERYTALAKVIYPTPHDFRRAFDDAKRGIKDPAGARPPKGVVLFEPPPNNPLRVGPHHDLRALLDETLVVGSKLVGKPLRHDGTVQWTRRFMKGWYEMADFLGPLRGRIRINLLLQSPDVSAETMRFFALARVPAHPSHHAPYSGVSSLRENVAGVCGSEP